MRLSIILFLFFTINKVSSQSFTLQRTEDLINEYEEVIKELRSCNLTVNELKNENLVLNKKVSLLSEQLSKQDNSNKIPKENLDKILEKYNSQLDSTNRQMNQLKNDYDLRLKQQEVIHNDALLKIQKEALNSLTMDYKKLELSTFLRSLTFGEVLIIAGIFFAFYRLGYWIKGLTYDKDKIRLSLENENLKREIKSLTPNS